MNKNILSPFYFALFTGFFLFNLCFLGARPALAYGPAEFSNIIFEYDRAISSKRLELEEELSCALVKALSEDSAIGAGKNIETLDTLSVPRLARILPLLNIIEESFAYYHRTGVGWIRPSIVDTKISFFTLPPKADKNVLSRLLATYIPA